MVNASEVAASTVLGAFALLTARNSLIPQNQEPEVKGSAKSIGSVSSRSTVSTPDAEFSASVERLKSLTKTISRSALTSYEMVNKVAIAGSSFVFSHIREGISSPEVISLEPTPGTIDIVHGAARATDNISILTSSEVLWKNIPEVQKFGEKNVQSTWHIGCNGVDMATLKIFTDYSVLNAINFTTLVATSPQEVLDFAILAEYVSSELGIPVANAFDGVSARNQTTTVSAVVGNEACLNANQSILKNFEEASLKLLKRPFSSVCYQGPLDAEVVFICLGSVSPVFLRLAEKVEEIGILTVKLLNPLSTKDLLENIPNTCKRVCIVEYAPNAESTVLFSKVAGALCSVSRDTDSFLTVINSIDIAEVDQSVASLVITNATAHDVERSLVVNQENAKTFEDKLTLLTSSSTYGSLLGYSQQGSVLYQPAKIEQLTIWQETTDKEVQLPQYMFISKQSTTRLDTISGIKRTDFRLSNSIALGTEFDHFGLNKTPLAAVNIDASFVLLAAKSVAQNGKLLLMGDSRAPNLSLLSRVTKAFIYTNSVRVFYSRKTTSLVDILDRSNHFQIRAALFRESRPITEEEEPVFINRRRPRPTHVYQSLSEKYDSYRLAWNVMFKDSFQTQEALRPSEHGVSIATVRKFERLTPDEYNRNIFHVEFDISGTGLKYEIGDALGVFGENDEAKVAEFIKAYGLDADEVVSLPSRGHMPTNKVEYVSVKHLLTKKLDLFGKVPKRFYVDLAAFATSRYEKLKLLHTGTDDAELFKLGSWETVTPAELLLQYKSCKLSVQDMIDIIPEIKPRHYSISSSMKMSPTSVHLLVVAVDWVTPLGKKGEGQCTRFLKSLKIGQKVCVDIQKSVLRLPPNPEQPIVMAGLGTGMAPFRAFVQQRYFLKRMGVKIGPMVLYFGARHKAQEWLYGEELEKYERMGLLRLGLAWSRDQKHKVYIQHKIQEDSALLKDYLKDKKGYFYLCGPTWPVPDVRDAINSGLQDENAVAELKEDGRYILEVY